MVNKAVTAIHGESISDPLNIIKRNVHDMRNTNANGKWKGNDCQPWERMSQRRALQRAMMFGIEIVASWY